MNTNNTETAEWLLHEYKESLDAKGRKRQRQREYIRRRRLDPAFRVEERAKGRAYYARLTDEQKKERTRRSTERRRATDTDEKRAKRTEQARHYWRAWKLTHPEEWEERKIRRREYTREKYRRDRAAGKTPTPEQKARQKQYRQKSQAMKFLAMTDEQKKEFYKQRYAREWQR